VKAAFLRNLWVYYQLTDGTSARFGKVNAKTDIGPIVYPNDSGVQQAPESFLLTSESDEFFAEEENMIHLSLKHAFPRLSQQGMFKYGLVDYSVFDEDYGSTQCDRIEPLCSQCKRAGKPCGGYRDVPSFMFRIEIDKAARQSAEAKAKSEARRRLEDGANPVHFIGGSSLRFFINQYVTPMAVSMDGSMHVSIVQPSSYIGPIFLDQSSQDAVVSVSLAAMSNVKRNRELRISSQEKHEVIIKSVQQAVGDAAETNPHRMFHMIVMLSLYKVLSSTHD
jgi:hypothetical protein